MAKRVLLSPVGAGAANGAADGGGGRGTVGGGGGAEGAGGGGAGELGRDIGAEVLAAAD